MSKKSEKEAAEEFLWICAKPQMDGDDARAISDIADLSNKAAAYVADGRMFEALILYSQIAQTERGQFERAKENDRQALAKFWWREWHRTRSIIGVLNSHLRRLSIIAEHRAETREQLMNAKLVPER